MNPQDEVLSLLAMIINEVNSKKICKLKFGSISSSLNTSYENFKSNFKPGPNIDLHKIIDILKKLYAQITIVNVQSLFSYFLEQKKTIEGLMSDINLSLDNLNAELSKIGVEERHKFSADYSYQDFIEIFDLLDQNINILNQRKKEIKEILSQCSNKISNIDNKSPKEILDEYKDKVTELSKEDYPLGDQLRDTKWYSLYTKENDQHIFILEIKDNKKYLQRALEIYSTLDNNSTEIFEGFFTDEEEDSNIDNPKVFIVTK